MVKKTFVAGTGLLLLLAVLFGSRLIPYAQTAYSNVTEAVNDSVSVKFQIQAAEKQLAKIGPEIHEMVRKVAKEQAQITQLQRELKRQENGLEKSYDEMMTLREHLQSGDSVYVATNGKGYRNARVEEDLRNRFSVYQTAEQTVEKSNQIIEIRKQALDNAFVKLDEAKALQRELEVQLANLNARERMVDVAKTASNISIDDSQIARTQDMINDISARLDAEEIMINMVPEYMGSIPVSKSDVADGDILEDMDRYFTGKADKPELVTK